MRDGKYLIKVSTLGLILSLFALIGVACGDNEPDTITPTPADPETPVITQPEPVADVFEWDLVWSDEFESTTIDTTRWNFEINCWGGGNNERQCYTDSPTNAFIENGVLNITAIPEQATGYATEDGSPGAEVTRDYTSARLTTRDKGEWTYGRFEIRAKPPSGQGAWPALWLLSADNPYGPWAASGEIDIFEAINLKADDEDGNPEDRVHGTLHYGREWPGNVFSGTSYRLPDGSNPADDFHTYALEWEEGEIRWYVDGFHYATQVEDGWYSQYPAVDFETGEPILDPASGEPIWLEGLRGAPFNADFFFIMNLAVGGNWPEGQNEGGVDSSAFPQTFEIDYVRVYECSAMRRGGRGCATVGDEAVLVGGHLPPGVAPEGYAQPSEGDYVVFDDGINPVGIRYNSWNPEGIVSFDEVADTQRGTIFTVDKSENAGGNVYFESTAGSINMTDWEANGIIEFDYRVNSIGEDVPLLIKIDSGWPNVSDIQLPTDAIGEWQSYRIAVSDLAGRGNSLAAGAVSLGAVSNVFVIDPVTGPINVSFDNIRFTEGDTSAITPPTVGDGGDDTDGDTSGDSETSNLPSGYGQPPEYVVFDQDGISTEGDVLQYDSFNPDGAVSHMEVDDAERGKILNVSKTGATGNVFFSSGMTPIDLSGWSSAGEIAFDYRVNSAEDGVQLLVKIDSGWPHVSDVVIPTDSVGDWQTYSIEVSDLADNGNSIDPSGSFDLSAVLNVFVIEPNGVMDVDFANIRYTGGDATAAVGPSEEETSSLPTGYGQPPEYVVFGQDGISMEGDVLRYDSFNPDGAISHMEVDDAERGKILNVSKTGAMGNVFFSSGGTAIDLSGWSSAGEIAFDYRVNSAEDGVQLLVKIDSGWPHVSDVTIPTDNVGDWQTYSIGVSDLADNGNSIDPSGSFDLSAVLNVFVIEPNGVMDVDFANIRYIVP